MNGFKSLKDFFRLSTVSPVLRFSGSLIMLLALYLLPSTVAGQVSVEAEAIPDSSAILFPVVGGEIFYVRDEQNLVNFYKLIPVGSARDKEKLASYLTAILRDADAKVIGDMTVIETILGFVYFDDERTSYIFISSKSEDIVTKEPYIDPHTRTIWFDMEGIIPDTAEFVSIWAFTRARTDDFRIALRMSAKAQLEIGRHTLLPEEFKRGKPYKGLHQPFRIHAYGEYYSEPFIQTLSQESDTFAAVDFISYSDSLAVQRGSMFGFRYELIDSTREGTYTFRIIRPALPDGEGAAQAEYFEERECVFEEVDDLIWEFENIDEVLPGTWLMQIMDGERIVFEKEFFISILLPKSK
jgi:hypothetical protein